MRGNLVDAVRKGTENAPAFIVKGVMPDEGRYTIVARGPIPSDHYGLLVCWPRL